MFDPSLIFAICFVIFLIIALKFGLSKSLGALDAQIGEIKNTIDAAMKNLRMAENTLKNERETEIALVEEIKGLFESTDRQVAEMKKEWSLEIKHMVELRQQGADLLMDQIRATVIQELRETLTVQARDVLEEIMAKRIDPNTHSQINDLAIGKLSQVIANGDDNTSSQPSTRAPSAKKAAVQG